MRQQKGEKINQLHKLLPEGLVVDAAWLERHGYSSALRSRYVQHGWLEQPTRGVYRRPAPSALRWQNVVVSLQTLLGVPVIVGGRTALEAQGFAHYLRPGGPAEIHLYGDVPAPYWLSNLGIDGVFVFHNAKALFRNQPITFGLSSQKLDLRTGDGRSNDALHSGLTEQSWGHWDWPLTLSTPERAVLELLAEVPKRETFHQADMLIEGLRTLSPRRLQKLLEDCKSVKVKRLFFWFVERHQHAWLKNIDRAKIDLGKGKRSLVKGGKLDTKYQITVPEDMNADR